MRYNGTFGKSSVWYLGWILSDPIEVEVWATWGSTAFGPQNFQKSHPFHSNTYKVTKMNSICNNSSTWLICYCVFNWHTANFPLNTCIRKLIQPNMPLALLMYLSLDHQNVIRVSFTEYYFESVSIVLCKVRAMLVPGNIDISVQRFIN